MTGVSVIATRGKFVLKSSTFSKYAKAVSDKNKIKTLKKRANLYFL